jgi:hypothetical protein
LSSFGCEGLRFGSVDLERWPSIGKDQGIDVDSGPCTLPVMQLVDGGKVGRRLPPLKGGRVVKTLLDKEGIVAYFEIDRRSLIARSAAARK